MIIETLDLKRNFQVGSETIQALKGINLSINKGEFVSIMGPSGSGKTTLMNIIGCLDTPSSGKYFLNEQSINEMNDNQLAKIRNKEIGFVFQSFHLLAKNSALDNVLLPMKYAGKNSDESIERAKEVLDQVGLSDRINHGPTELSGGQQQRVAIARALVQDPAFVLADEPTGNLDKESGINILNILKELNNQGKTVIMITHNQEHANMFKKVIELVDGKIV